MLSTNGQKWLKVLHLISVCCWLGGALALYILYFPKASVESDGEIYGINRAIQWVDMGIVIIPGACGCFLTGLLYSWKTKWGFFKHRWILVKWIITISLISFGTAVLGPMEKEMLALSYQLGLSSLTDPTYRAVEDWKMVFGTIQSAFLVVLIVLSVLKPWGKKK